MSYRVEGLLSQDELHDAPPAHHPDDITAMAATLSREVFSHPAWIFERKLDGIRCIAHRLDDSVRLWTRNHNDLGSRFPELATALAEQKADDFVIDGEVVTFDGDVTSFSLLQQGGRPVYLYAFDLLHADGRDLRDLSLRRRKAVLRDLLVFDDPLRFTPHRNADGEAAYEQACSSGWEGVIAKDATSTYVGTRSTSWLKLKCEAGQELVIGGWTEPRGTRTDFGALLLGYFDDEGRFRYAGKVGTGFDRRTLRDLGAKLRTRIRDGSPFDDDGVPEKQVHWTTPDLVCQVGFTEWTEDGRLRHPRFLGLREDKDPTDVVRERPR